MLAWLADVDLAGAANTNPDVEVTYADEYVVDDAQTWADSGEGGRSRALEVGPDDGPAAAAAFQNPTREEQRDMGLEIISREEWEDRLRREGKGK